MHYGRHLSVSALDTATLKTWYSAVVVWSGPQDRDSNELLRWTTKSGVKTMINDASSYLSSVTHCAPWSHWVCDMWRLWRGPHSSSALKISFHWGPASCGATGGINQDVVTVMWHQSSHTSDSRDHGSGPAGLRMMTTLHCHVVVTQWCGDWGINIERQGVYSPPINHKCILHKYFINTPRLR